MSYFLVFLLVAWCVSVEVRLQLGEAHLRTLISVFHQLSPIVSDILDRQLADKKKEE